MEVPCVRVPREEGEAARRRLADEGVVDHGHEIAVAEGTLYVPVADPEAVPAEFEVVRRNLPERTPQRTPADLLDFEPGYERLGDVVIVDEDDPERARRIADAVVASDVPARAVFNRASKVKGEFRVRDWELLACDESGDADEEAEDDRACTETIHREYGHEFLLDIAAVYFSPRLATERHRVVEQVREGERAVDMFAGVGPFAVPMAARGAETVGVDLNPRAVEYLRENARRNGVADRLTAVEGDVREVAREYEGWADRLVMNLPHSADEFLDAATALAGEDCALHYYDIAPEADPFAPGRAAIEAAADAAGYAVDVLDERAVRSYSPHELNVCLDARLTR